MALLTAADFADQCVKRRFTISGRLWDQISGRMCERVGKILLILAKREKQTLMKSADDGSRLKFREFVCSELDWF